MPAYWSSSAAELIEAGPEAVVARLAHAQALAFRVNEAAQLRAWRETVALLRGALSGEWRVLLEFPLLRLGRRDLHSFEANGTAFVTIMVRPKLRDGRDNPLADLRVRQALALSIDRRKIVENITRMGETPSSTYVPPRRSPRRSARWAAATFASLPRAAMAARRILASVASPACSSATTTFFTSAMTTRRT